MKPLRVTDTSTDLGVLALRLSDLLPDDPATAQVLSRGGFRGDLSSYVILVHLDPEIAVEWDPFRWANATLRAAHLHLVSGGYDAVEPGGTLDVRALRERLVAGGS